MTLDPLTIVFELANFLVLVLLLKKFLFKPVRRVIARRQQEIADRDAQVRAREEAVTHLRRDYEDKLARVGEEADEIRREAAKRADTEASALLDEARAKGLRAREQLQLEVSSARQRMLTELAGEVSRVAVDGARRILADVGSQSLVDAYARVGAQRLQASRGSRLVRDPVRVWVPPDAEVESLREALLDVFGPGVHLEIRTDPALVGGVRLMQGEVEVDANAGAVLADWLGAAATAHPDPRASAVERPA